MVMKKSPYCRFPLVLTLVLAGLWLFACGQSQPVASGPTPTSLLAVTPLTTHVFAQPTTLIKQATSEATATPEAAANVDLSRGERTYQTKGCVDCHGAQGEGVADKAEKLAGTSLSEEEFTDLLRTGGAGKLGNDHLYGTQAISPSGMKALYAYVKSFK
jgi:mono/diheme cytochrome c family protein